MTDSIPSPLAYWTALDQCLHLHHDVIAGDLRLQAAHAAFQLQLATFRALQPGDHTGHLPARATSLRTSLEFLLDEIARNILSPALELAPDGPDGTALQRKGHLSPHNLLELTETTVRYLRDHPSLWTRFGLAALQVRALADLQDAYALETGSLAPSGNLEERTRLTTEEMARLISQELDPLVSAHDTGTPDFVADYQLVRNPRQPSQEQPLAQPRSRFRLGFKKRPEVSLPN